jgi:hypothetical protein
VCVACAWLVCGVCEWCGTSDACGVVLGLAHHERGGLAVERVGRVGVEQQLWQEDLKHVEQVEHG